MKQKSVGSNSKNVRRIAGWAWIVCCGLIPQSLPGQQAHYPKPVRTDVNMSVLVEQIEGMDAADSSELAIYSPNGLVVGMMEIAGPPPWGLPVWGDDGTTDTLDGCRNGDSLRFVVWIPKSGREYRLIPVLSEGVVLYRTNTLVFLKLCLPEPTDSTGSGRGR